MISKRLARWPLAFATALPNRVSAATRAGTVKNVNVSQSAGTRAYSSKTQNNGERDASKRRVMPSASSQYQKLSQLEHVLKRPDTYIGSVEKDETQIWTCDGEGNMHFSKISMVPGLYKIFDEILVNAADNKVRDPGMSYIKVTIDPAENKITVRNDGKGIPIQLHDKENVWIPELIFGHLLTSSNYNDDEKKITGGRNGFGAKLCNIFSTKFIVNTASQEQEYTQVWTDNMTKKQEPLIVDRKKKSPKSWTEITFWPDLEKFGMDSLDDDTVSVLRRRAWDLAGTTAGIKVHLNGEQIPVSNFQSYVKKFTDALDHEQVKVLYTQPNDRWEVAFGISDGTFNQMSFVNSIATTSGGTHVNYICDSLITYVQETMNKKFGKRGGKLTRPQIKNNMFLFINCKIANPSFTSQTKEQLTTKVSLFGSKCEFPPNFLKDMVNKTGLMDSLMAISERNADKMLSKQDGGKKRRLTGILKLDDANKAGTKESNKCILILTEGDSAKALAMQGVEVVGRDYIGCYPLRGKMLNVREASQDQILKNKEISELKKIIGLQHKKQYTSVDGLRYGHIMIMTDQDHDGSHIKGLIINFLESSFPGLLDIPDFLLEFITPIIKVSILRGNKVHAVKNFFNTIEYENWRETEGKKCKWTHKYFKGLGTSLKSDFREYFSNLSFHQKTFLNLQEGDKDKIELAFAKNRADDRKQWLQEYVPGTFLDPQLETIPIKEFIDKELVLFSLNDCARSIPSVMDGLKPSQRKVMYVSFLRKPFTREVKVSQLGADAVSKAAYHHGEASIEQTIIGLAQDFIGSNNIYWLMPQGGFGSRATGGKDASAARYIHTLLNPITKFAFNQNDENVLNYLQDDESTIEPEYYVPVLPTLLVNGSEGIGTGWSSNIPSFNPSDVVENLRRMMENEPLKPMAPWYRGWTGTIEKVPGNNQQFRVCGRIEELDNNTLAITELPIKMWTETMKEFLLRSIIGSSKESKDDDKKKNLPEFIDDVTEEHGNGNVRFIVKLSDENMEMVRQQGVYKKFKLIAPMSTSNMVAFDPQGRLRRYATAEDILKEFYYVRLDYYQRRKDNMTNNMKNELEKLTSQARFIKLIIEKDLNLNNKAKKVVVKDLEQRKFPRFASDGVPVWPDQKDETVEAELDVSDESDDEGVLADEEVQDPTTPNVAADVVKPKTATYDYLLNMSISSLTKERYARLLKQRDGVEQELNELLAKTIQDLWRADLDNFESAWAKFLETDRHAREFTPTNKNGKNGAKSRKRKADSDDEDSDFGGAKKKKRAPRKKAVTEVFREGVFVEPPPVEEFAKQVKKEPGVKKEPRVKKEPKDGSAPPADGEKPKRKPAVKKEPKEPKEPKATKAKAAPKKKAISDESSSEEDMSDIEEVSAPVAPRQRSKRAAATKKSYTPPVIDADDSMAVEDDDDESDSDGRFDLSD